MKLLCIKESLKIKAGGAEKVFTLLINKLSKTHQITLLTFDNNEGTSFYPINSQINWVMINQAGLDSQNLSMIPGQFLKRIKTAKNSLKQTDFDAIIVFGDFMNIFAIVLAKILKLPVIISDRNNPFKKTLSFKWRILQKITYPFADKLVVMTKEQAACYSKAMQKKTEIIPNPVIKKTDNNKYETQKTDSPYILSIGKLKYQKGLDILIEAFANIANSYPKWKLIILGEGEDKEKLSQLVTDKHLQNKVLFKGIVANPAEFLKNADIFVLSSRFEGFPNALGEAMSSGLPVISTNCPFGPKAMVNHRQNGLLVECENIEDLTKNIKLLIENEDLRLSLGREAEKIAEKFSLTKITDMWLKLLGNLLN